MRVLFAAFLLAGCNREPPKMNEPPQLCGGDPAVEDMVQKANSDFTFPISVCDADADDTLYARLFWRDGTLYSRISQSDLVLAGADPRLGSFPFFRYCVFIPSQSTVDIEAYITDRPFPTNREPPDLAPGTFALKTWHLTCEK